MTTLPLMYLDTPNPSLWNYRDLGDVLVWGDTGETIMLAANAAALCQSLLRDLKGLPSLTAILFVSDALSKGWNRPLAYQRVELLRSSIASRTSKHDKDAFSHVVDWLVSLGQLSTDLRKGIHAQCAFLAEIWEKFPAASLEIDQQDAEIAIAWLNLSVNERVEFDTATVDISSYRSKKAVQALEYASLLTIDEKAIRNRLNTGIGSVTELPIPADPIEIKDPVTQLLNKLHQDTPNSEQGFLASLAWELSSLIALPRKPSEPDDLPIGGVSDISNRGNPERLLMTELAAEPDLLIARIANGQALYLRRESPPKPRPQTRNILIENGIRCWGEQRFTMLAFAFAIAASEEKRVAQVQITTLAGHELFDEDFTTTDGLAKALERLYPAPHPGQALENLVQRYHREKLPLLEPLLIVTAATANDPQFASKTKLLPTPYLLAVVEPDRWVEIREQTERGSAVWKRLQLKPAVRAKPKPPPSDAPQFTKLICSPLRFLSDMNASFVQAFQNANYPGAWLLNKQCRLLYFNLRGSGGIELGSLPTDNVIAACTPTNDSIQLVLELNGRSDNEVIHYLAHVSLYDGIRCQTLELASASPRSVKYCFDQGNLWRIGQTLELIDPQTGKIKADCPRRQRHLGGPFFGDRDLLLASYVNGAIEWHFLGRCISPIGFVVRTASGPFAVATDFSWTQRFTGTNEPEQSTGRKVLSNLLPELIRVNYDQTEALATISRVTKTVGFNTPAPHNDAMAISISLQNRTLSASRLSVTEATRDFDRHRLHFPINHSVSARFNYVGCHADGLLLARNRSKISIVKCEKGRFFLDEVRESGLADTLHSFSDDIPQDNERIRRKWRLNRADIGTCTIWLDSRGLLHLRDSDGAELSLVMAQSSMAGWFSDGELFGPSYFTTQVSNHASEKICRWYARFLEQCYR
ncbi:MAG: hypothetical protein J0M26_22570 [Planctomycetes bacterium]|nr:hypothetical protein [Planctomycetota bacterium]